MTRKSIQSPQRNTRRTVLRILGTAGTVSSGIALAGCSGNDGETTSTATPSSSNTTHTVDMTDNLVFDPDSITIDPGETIVWENVGSLGHSVTAYEEKIPADAEYFASGNFASQQAAEDAYAAGDPDSGDIPGGASYQHTFKVTGTYEYFCIPHEMSGMKGTVEVTG